MGRWAQARRRFSPRPAGGLAGPPPAPIIGDVEGELVITATGGDDEGGLLRWFYSTTLTPPGEPNGEQGWISVWDLGSLGEFETGYYWAQEEGNGVAYVGNSPLSVPYERM